MRRKDYELLAQAVRAALSDLDDGTSAAQREGARHLARELAWRLYKDNKAFERNRWLRDAGVFT